MLIGVPKEIKNHEYRVGLTPESVAELVEAGNQVMVETNAGDGIGASDETYRAHGAEIVTTAKEVFDRADMIIKVKEPQAAERAMLRPGQILYTYLHLAPDPEQTKDLKFKLNKCNFTQTSGTVVLNNDGRADKPLAEGKNFLEGKYELVFYVGDYFKKITDTKNIPFLD